MIRPSHRRVTRGSRCSGLSTLPQHPTLLPQSYYSSTHCRLDTAEAQETLVVMIRPRTEYERYFLYPVTSISFTAKRAGMDQVRYCFARYQVASAPLAIIEELHYLCRKIATMVICFTTIRGHVTHPAPKLSEGGNDTLSSRLFLVRSI